MTQNQERFLDEYHSVFPKMYRYVRARVPHTETAEDIVSDIFLKAWKHCDTFQEKKGNREQWLIGIARYTIIDYWRKNKSTINLEDVEHQLQSHNTHEEIHFDLLIQNLSEEAQSLLRLRYVDGLSHNDIAELLQKNPPAIRMSLSRLYHTLRKKIQPYE